MDGLIVATIMAGIILIIMGIAHFGSLIKFIPYTITTGFTAGIAITLLVGQLKDFFGLDMGAVPSEFLEKIAAYSKYFHTLNLHALLIGIIALVILILWPYVTDKIPGSLIAIIVTTVMVKFLPLNVNTIGSVYGELSSSLPKFSLPQANMSMIIQLASPAFTIAILAAIESLLSCVVSDGMIGSKHRSNAVLVVQGVGNIACSLRWSSGNRCDCPYCRKCKKWRTHANRRNRPFTHTVNYPCCSDADSSAYSNACTRCRTNYGCI